MTIKLKWTKDELITENLMAHDDWFTCGVCRMGATAADFIHHKESCPFSDDTVMFLTFTVGPETDADICGRCETGHENCPVFSVLGTWDMVTHERLKTLCSDYGERCTAIETAALHDDICGECDIAVISCPACIHAEDGVAVTDHKKLLTICKRYKNKCGI